MAIRIAESIETMAPKKPEWLQCRNCLWYRDGVCLLNPTCDMDGKLDSDFCSNWICTRCWQSWNTWKLSGRLVDHHKCKAVEFE